MSELRRLPQYYLLNGRPVKVVETPGGGMASLGYDRQTGEFVSDIGFLVALYSKGDVDAEIITEEEFDRIVEQLRSERAKGQ